MDEDPPVGPVAGRRRRLDLQAHPAGGIRVTGHPPAHASQARRAFGLSIEYSLRTIISYVQRYGDKNTVLIVLGDHQPHTVISGQGATHDVPISVIAKDPKVTDQIRGWGWDDGLRPTPHAPVWPMQSFRDRFLTAFGSTPSSH